MNRFILIFALMFFLFSCNNDMRREKVVAQVKKTDERIIAKVNGIPITISDYYREEKQLPRQLRELLKKKEKRKQFIENLITKELLFQEAKKLHLEKNGKIIEMINEYKKNILINEVINNKIKNAVKVSDKEAFKYYMKHRNSFMESEKVEFEKFIFKDYTDAENFLKNHDIHQCFNTCYSEVVPMESVENISPNVASELKNLKKGKYNDNIILTDKGYMILKLRNRNRGKLLPFYKVKGEIIKNLRKIKEKEVLKEYVNNLKENATIQIFSYNDNDSVK